MRNVCSCECIPIASMATCSARRNATVRSWFAVLCGKSPKKTAESWSTSTRPGRDFGFRKTPQVWSVWLRIHESSCTMRKSRAGSSFSTKRDRSADPLRSGFAHHPAADQSPTQNRGTGRVWNRDCRATPGDSVILGNFWIGHGVDLTERTLYESAHSYGYRSSDFGLRNSVRSRTPNCWAW